MAGWQSGAMLARVAIAALVLATGLVNAGETTPVERGAAGAPKPSRIAPSFVAQAGGGTLSIDGRNDGDAAYRCVLNFTWVSDDDPTAMHPVTQQVTLPGHQVNRVVLITGPYRQMRFVSGPSWSCLVAD